MTTTTPTKRCVRPVNDRVVVRPLDEVSSGGIVLTQTAKTSKLRGIVLAVGEGRQKATGERIPIDICKVGDEIIYGNVANTVLDDLDGKPIHIIVEQAIVAVVSYE
jgi:co-chaperonin GroES (HSP10)